MLVKEAIGDKGIVLMYMRAVLAAMPFCEGGPVIDIISILKCGLVTPYDDIDLDQH